MTGTDKKKGNYQEKTRKWWLWKIETPSSYL